MANTESMTRDEILEAIREASASHILDPLTTDEIANRMRKVERLADTYMDSERWDNQYIAEALSAALCRFASMLRSAR